MSEFLCALLQAAREIIPALATREAHLLQAGAKGAGGDISIGADLLCEAIFVKHLSHIAHIDSEESGFIPAGSQMDTNKDSRARAVDSMDCHGDKSARNDDKNSVNKKVDSSTANLESTFDNAATLSKAQAAANEDSGTSPSDSKIFTQNAKNVSESAKDSRIFDKNAQKVSESQAAGFCDDFLKKLRFVGCQGVGEGIYLGDNEQAHAADSRKSAQKPTPKPKKAQSTNKLTIILDPLDGSDNYLSNIPYYGASLALCDSTGQVLEAAVVNFCSAQIIYGNRDTPNATRIHLFTQKHSPIAPTRAKCGIFEKAYSHPEIARELYAHKLKFRSLGASALSLAYALEHNFFLFCGAIRKYDALAGLFLCRDLAIAREKDFLLVSQNKQDFGMIEQILYKHHTKHN